MIKFKSFFLLFSFNYCVANTNQEAFLQANKLCTTGHFAEALVIYNGINAKGAVVWYNMGNCYFYQNELVKAIWSWLQVCKIGSSSEIINSRYNIKIAQDLLTIKEPSGYRTIDLLNCYMSFFNLQLLILLSVFLLFGALFLAKKAVVKRIIKTAFLLMELSIIGITFWYAKQLDLVYAVVQNKTDLVAGPANDYHTLGTVSAGQILRVKLSEAEWCYVVGQVGVKGWLAKKDLLIV